jgi:DMSO/TMAO reductase YedYZ molybdopterin-dependent catalytic subunit
MTSKQERIVAARLALKQRFEVETNDTASLADPKPLGTGALNRHGMPKLPVGQTVATNWPVLDLGVLPRLTREEWRLEVHGACGNPVSLDFEQLLAVEQTVDVSDFHCVTTSSLMDLEWKGVRVADVLALAEPNSDAKYLLCHGYDGYTTNVTLAEALKPDVLVTYQVNGEPLPAAHGGPVRMITPQLYAWKGTKWIKALELLTREQLGFWEERGYSSTALPWRNDRYS